MSYQLTLLIGLFMLAMYFLADEKSPSTLIIGVFAIIMGIYRYLGV